MGRVDSDTNVTYIAADFILSAEFSALYDNNLFYGDFINRLYANVLDCTYKADIYDYWIGELRTGYKSRQQVLTSFSDSDKNVIDVTAIIAYKIHLDD